LGLLLWVHLHLTSWQDKPCTTLHFWRMARYRCWHEGSQRWYWYRHARREHSEGETT
jgi:hypothetical protein